MSCFQFNFFCYNLDYSIMTTVFLILSVSPSAVVNVSRSQLLFTSLVSVEVQKDQLISRVLQDRWPPATRPCCQDKTSDSPSLLPFMSTDMLRQKPLPPEEERVNYKPKPLPRPNLSNFDLYRRQIRWESTP